MAFPPNTFANQSGNVPASQLDANFTACFPAAGGTFTGDIAVNVAGGTGVVRATGNSIVTAFLFGSSAGTSGGVGTETNHPFSLYANDTPFATLGTAGQFAVGVTPGGWSGNGWLSSQTVASNTWALDAYAEGSSPNGAILARVDNAAQKYADFTFNGSTAIGTISVTGGGTGVAYNTTSDERLKDFAGQYAAAAALSIIRADPVRTFTWNDLSPNPGQAAIGWGAQTSYGIEPSLASPGHGEPGDEDFKAWGVDPSKRAAFLWAAIGSEGGILDRVEALEALVAKLLEARANGVSA